MRVHRPLPGGVAARRHARRALAAAHSPSPNPLDRDGARGEGADGRVDVDPGAHARSSSAWSPRTSTRRASGTRARCSSKRSRTRTEATTTVPAGSRSADWSSPSRASASGSSARGSGSRCCGTSSTPSRRCWTRTSPAAGTTGCSRRRWSRPASTPCSHSGVTRTSSRRLRRSRLPVRCCGPSRCARSVSSGRIRTLLQAAVERFEAFGLGWHAAETRRLVLQS